MTLVRNRPIQTRPLENDLFTSFDRLFDQLGGAAFADGSETAAFPLDLYETNEALILETPLPGVNPDDLDLSLEGRRLTLRATVPESQTEDRRYWMQSIPRGRIDRSIKLPVSVDAEAIDARIRDGLLVLTMPKAQESKVRKIEVARD